MQFNDTSNKTGLIQLLEMRTNLGDAGISGDATLLKQFTAQINLANMKAFSIIMQADGIWTVDDANHTNSPKAKANLVSGQQSYKILSTAPDATQDWLEIVEVSVKDAGGVFQKLSYRAEKDFAEPTVERTETGVPSTYFVRGREIFLDPPTSYNSALGLEVLFNRAPLSFVSTDTTKVPGFASLFHEYLVLVPTYWWEKYKRVGDAEQTKRDIMEMEKAMGDFYGNRSKYEPTMLKRAIRTRLK